MPAVGASRRKFAELVPDHVLSDEDGHMAAAVVDGDGEADHFRQNGRAARPGADDGLLARLLHLHHLGNQLGVRERAFLRRPGHRLNLVPAADDVFVGVFAAARAGAQRGLSPRAARPREADRCAALTTAVRMVSRVHDGATHARPAAHQALAPGPSQLDLAVLDVADLADRGHTIRVDAPDLARRQPHERIIAFAGEELRGAAGAANELAALTFMHLQVVDRRAGGDVAHGERVAGLDLGSGASHDAIADLETDRPEDVALLPVRVVDKGDARRAVWVVLDGGDLAGNAGHVATEVDDAQATLGAAAAMADCDAALIIAPGLTPQRGDKRLLRLRAG